MRARTSFISIIMLLLAACSGQASDNLPLTVVALQSTPQSLAAHAPADWSPPPRAPTPESTPTVEDTQSTVTPGPTIIVPTSAPPLPLPVLPAFTFSPDDLVLIHGVVISDVLQVDTSSLVLIENTVPLFKLIPDSELVYGPAYADFDVVDFVNQYNGNLEFYRENVEGQILTGPEVVDYVARQYSVGPRVLLALLEYSSGWITQPSPDWVAQTFPMGHADPTWHGLYAQLTWSANRLNYGYYGRKHRGLATVRFADDTYTLVADELNAGTVAVHTVLGLTTSYDVWQRAVGPNGFLATYRKLFGDPFAYDRGVTLPDDLQQPPLELPWAEGQTWYYSGGPHGGWGGGSAWAAVDFVPPDTRHGCYDSDAWVTASAAGVVVRSQLGMIVVDLDGDGLEQTGWVLNYAHIASRDKVYAGTHLDLGDWIGHPSCEGGVSTGTHLHLARRYNGEWVLAGKGRLPMVLSGWTVRQGSSPYDGEIVKGEVVRTAIAGRSEGGNDLRR